jgi:hypothetical protein
MAEQLCHRHAGQKGVVWMNQEQQHHLSSKVVMNSLSAHEVQQQIKAAYVYSSLNQTFSSNSTSYLAAAGCAGKVKPGKRNETTSNSDLERQNTSVRNSKPEPVNTRTGV